VETWAHAEKLHSGLSNRQCCPSSEQAARRLLRPVGAAAQGCTACRVRVYRAQSQCHRPARQVFHEKVQTSQVWLRDCTMVGALPLLLFGGEVRRQAGAGAGRVAIDGWLLLDCQPKVAVLLVELRARLDRLLQVRLLPRRARCACLSDAWYPACDGHGVFPCLMDSEMRLKLVIASCLHATRLASSQFREVGCGGAGQVRAALAGPLGARRGHHRGHHAAAGLGDDGGRRPAAACKLSGQQRQGRAQRKGRQAVMHGPAFNVRARRSSF